jgi:hypothetical protein
MVSNRKIDLLDKRNEPIADATLRDLPRYPRISTLGTELRGTGFADLRQEEVHAVGLLSDPTQLRRTSSELWKV